MRWHLNRVNQLKNSPKGASRPSGPFPVTKIETRILLDTPHTEMAISQGAYVLKKSPVSIFC